MMGWWEGGGKKINHVLHFLDVSEHCPVSKEQCIENLLAPKKPFLLAHVTEQMTSKPIPVLSLCLGF